MRHKHAAFGHFDHLAGYFMKARRAGHHIVGDTRELGNKRRNAPARIYERSVRVNHLLAIVHKNSQLGNAVIRGLAASRF